MTEDDDLMDEEAEMFRDYSEMGTYLIFDDYQDFTDTTAIYPEDGALEYLVLGLLSEAGEIAGKLKKSIRDGVELDNDAFMAEVGDCLWYIARIAAEQDTFLSDVAKMNVEKLSSRLERNVLGGSGDER